MEQNGLKDTKKSKAELWEQRIREWEASGLSQVEYCRRHDLKFATFAYWRKRFPAQGKATGSLRLVPLNLHANANSDPKKPSAPEGGITIEAGGVRLSVTQGFDTATLKQVLDLLKET